MFKKENFNDILFYISTALFIIASLMMILDYFQVIDDKYSFKIIFLLVSVSLINRGILKFKENKVWSIFLILLSTASFLVLVLGMLK